jgi:hypothetical protein
MSKIQAAITCVGGYVPEDKLTNFDLEKIVDSWLLIVGRFLGAISSCHSNLFKPFQSSKL